MSLDVFLKQTLYESTGLFVLIYLNGVDDSKGI